MILSVPILPMMHDTSLELSALKLLQTGESSLATQLEPADFHDRQYRCLFECIRSSIETDAAHAMNCMTVDERFAKIFPGTQPYAWLSWIVDAPYLGAPYQLSKRLKTLRARREAQGFSVQGDDETSFPNQFHDKARSLVSLVTSPRLSIDEMAQKIVEGVHMLPTGFARMDALCNGGLEDGGIFVIAARPGMGKTALAIHIVKNIISAGKTVYFGSLEMAQERILQRLFQCFWGESAEQVRLHASDMKQLPGDLIIDNPGYDIQRILNGMSAHLDADLFVLDYFQLIQMGGKESQFMKLELISNKLKEFCFEHKKPLLLLAQLNRQIENDRRNREPELADIRSCGALEQDAHVITFLWDKSAKENAGEAATLLKGRQGNTSADLKWIIRKNRNGRTGILDLDFAPLTMTFSESDDVDSAFRV